MIKDVVVVGAGHAGCEAANALAKCGFDTALITLNIEHIAKMPCNPSIGGPAKGIVVREIDALGGIMPIIADKTALQFKMLNTTKGPGVWSLRVQSDKLAYSEMMKEYLLGLDNLTVIEDLVTGLVVKDRKIQGVICQKSGEITAKAVILTTGTYMDSTIMVSSDTKKEGPDGDITDNGLSRSLKELGFRLFRLKTGTPARVYTDSIDFTKTKLERGTEGFLSFSTTTKEILPYDKQLPCYLTYTTEETLKIIKDNLDRSSMYSGVVKGVGPRYCPSIEDKVVRFADKERHQIFLEPESLSLDTTYIQGFSTSMPYDVQEKMIHSLIGLEKARIKKYAYAIEYDAIDPLEFKANLEAKKIENLFIAGQIFGTSGYEEAAGLGIMAGINVANKLRGKEPLILKRDEAYIGVMIDDLVTKGTKEPYRLLTSRAEYRLLLRHDNADRRLMKYGKAAGLISDERYEALKNKEKTIEETSEVLKNKYFTKSDKINDLLRSLGYDDLNERVSAYDLIKRPPVKLKELLPYLDLEINEELLSDIEIEIKYEGYISKARKEASRMHKMERMKLPIDLDYDLVSNLSLEAREKLNKTKPLTLGQASRISGINPSDIQVLAIYQKEHKNED